MPTLEADLTVMATGRARPPALPTVLLLILTATGCSRAARDEAPNAAPTPTVAATAVAPSPTSVAPVAPTPTPTKSVSATDAIQDIRNRYAEVGRRLQSFRRVERDASGLSTEGGELKAFFDGDALKLVTATLYGETGRAAQEVYYDEGDRPFFVFRRETSYDKPFGNVASEREHRFYFREGRMIRWLDGKREVPTHDARYAERQQEILELSRTLAEIARRR